MRISRSLICAVAYFILLPPLLPAQQVDTTAELTLDQAVALALRLSPSLAAGENAVLAAGARVDQAGLLPNPEFDLEIENFGGSGTLSGFDAAENTATVSQAILLGGKRKKRQAGAEWERVIAGRDFEAVRLDVIARTTAAFYQVLVAQQREELGIELFDLAESFAHTVQVRVDAGRVSPVEATRAEIEVARVRTQRARAVRDLEAARARLAATWGSSAPAFRQVAGDLPRPATTPPIETLRSFLMETPEITRLADRVQLRQRVLEFEKSLRLPDLNISVGRRRFEETGQSAWVAAVSLPIPIFDRNQGARRAANFEFEQARRSAEAVRIALDAELVAAFQRLDAAVQDVTIANREIVPSSIAAFAAVETGYREGKFGFLDVLNAQQALFDARSLSLDSHEEYLLSRTDLERLVGRTLGNRNDPAPNGSYQDPGEAR